jgi:hypothetical protein
MIKKQLLILASILIGLCTLIGVGLWKKANSIHVYSTEEQKKGMNSESVSKEIEFIYTEQEQLDIAKWKNRSMDDLIADAINGERAALYNLGECFFFGLDFPVDMQTANSYFAKSASLGFAPALEQISRMYMNDESNCFLGLVYKNLTISFGHTEFIRAYHDFRSQLIKEAGKNIQRIWNEIERIAIQKKAIILKNQKCSQKDKGANWLSLKNITDEDYQYDNDYWKDVFNGDNEIFEKSEMKQKDNFYLDRLHTVYYKGIELGNGDTVLESKIQAITTAMKKDLYSDSEIDLLKKRARSLAKRNYKYICKIESDAREAEKRKQVLEQYLQSI